MRLIRYIDGESPRIGVELDDGVFPTEYSDLGALIDAGPETLETLRKQSTRSNGLTSVDLTRRLAPLADHGELIFTGGNYPDHIAEAGLHPSEPVYFPKLRSAVIGPGQAIRIPTQDTQTDWEAELAFVIGRTAKGVPADRAADYIFGYTMVNDVSARDVLVREPLQVMLCKSPDTFCPLGPHVITADAVPDINDSPLELTTRLNGVVKQHAHTDEMLFSIGEILELLTQTVTLRPGDVVSTGTAGGTGMGRDPQEFMQPGDEISVAVTQVGELVNPVVAGWTEVQGSTRARSSSAPVST